MPRPSSPTSKAQVSWYSISLDALERLPHLAFRRWMKKPLLLPSGSTRGTNRQLTPEAVCASV